jgi:hypothetical protein
MKKLLGILILAIMCLIVACSKKEEAPVAAPAPVAEAAPVVVAAPEPEPKKDLGKDKEGQKIHKKLIGDDVVPVKK